MTTEIETKVISAIVELLDMDDASAVTSKTRIEDDLGIDSGLLLELFMMLEEQVPDLEIEPAELRPEQFATVESFAALIQSCTKEKVPA
ncbi:phosphopantetheine-binding protein [Thalassococcus sp. S3]|uniref:phosphopantetheine-binding protein n=1 Tax=Thalassococcus sp. S3 TaxID=2017482 RepID=UPI0010245BE3|nr:phosphopantetheine-binding protein [Thalassococcus sp. S3]QBF29669.1 phosphopantetheine-binding protein [Thalassococcus sp. S3]